MGREVKRVALDFDWPVNKVWHGYLNPFDSQLITCLECNGTGNSVEYNRLSDKWYGKTPFKPEERSSTPFTPQDLVIQKYVERHIHYTGNQRDKEIDRLCHIFNERWCHHLNDDDVKALIDKNELREFTHEWVEGKLCKKNPPYIPTTREVNEWSLFGLGHGSTGWWIVVTAECERLGYEPDCKVCGAEGSFYPSDEIKKQAEAWTSFEPPEGEGFQLWETVSEGSPISPVFVTAEELADWLATSPDYKWRRNDEGTTKAQWLAFINGPGWAMTGVITGGKYMTGVQAVSLKDDA